MANYLSPFQDCLPVKPKPKPPANTKPTASGTFGAAVLELTDASAQDISIGGKFRVLDKDKGAKLKISFVGTPTLTYSEGALPSKVLKAYGSAPVDIDMSALVAAGAFKVSKASAKNKDQVTWTFDPTALSLDFLAAGQTLTISTKLKVSDGKASVTKTVSVTIVGTNDAAILTGVEPIQALSGEDFPASLTTPATVSDLDFGQGFFQVPTNAERDGVYGAFDFSQVSAFNDPTASGYSSNGTIFYAIDNPAMSQEWDVLGSGQGVDPITLRSLDGTAFQVFNFDVLGLAV